jgi:Fe-S-cluster containining protein
MPPLSSQPIGDTPLRPGDRLPLTCTRAGTCCHGKMVWVNPWELACLARASGETVAAFRAHACEFGGIRLRFDGPAGWRGLPACHLYDPGRGCTLHAGRPLSCRLYPLARLRRGKESGYFHQGRRFPCLAGCPEVVDLPALSVRQYLAGQDSARGEAAQDAYIEVMQELADGAFILLLESGLAATGDRRTLQRWRLLGHAHPRALSEAIPDEWLEALTAPACSDDLDDPVRFAGHHQQLLQVLAQERFAALREADQLHDAACLMMALALQLGRSLGCAPEELARTWIATAKKHGARE